ncbi:lysophosphatidic acid phosphatase type 6-like [Haliotis cracherodii]|uniref:lysophosphatidic acid phosphatase type 6-like n=1 Tax=Haliotis cracherodii TaxID=6455 RepID=UPI0039EA9AB5
MGWWRLRRVSGYLGAVVVCGGCVARTCLTSGVSGETERSTQESGDSDEISSRGLTLRQVQVFFRHGARTPIHLTPNVEQATYRADIHNRVLPHTHFKLQLKSLQGDTIEKSVYERQYSKTVLRGGCVSGSLTTCGQQQMFELGQKLRAEYVSQGALLDTSFNQDQVYARSTNINRTIASARCVLAGIFGADELNKSGTASISISPLDNEVLLPNPHICAVVRDINRAAMLHFDNIPGILHDRLRLEKVLVRVDLDNEVLLPNPHICAVVRDINRAAMLHFDNIPGILHDRLRLEKVLGVDSSTSGHKVNFIDVRDDLIARQAHGLHVPEKLLSVQDMIESNATKIMYHAFCGQHEAEGELAVRLTAGPAMTMAINEMKAFIQGTSQRRACLYSVHDSLILPLTVILGAYEGRWPPFAADIRLELYVDLKGHHWVRARYCGKVVNIRGCDGPFCKYSDFMKSISQYLVEKDDYKRICSSNILKKIAKDLVMQNNKDEDDEGRSDTPAGL